MATPVADIAIRVGADITPLTKDLSKGSLALDKLGQKARDSAGGIAALAAASLAAGAAMVAGLYAKTADAIDQQAKLAQQLRTTVSSMATLERAGSLAGVSTEQLAAASKALDLNLSKAATGSKAQDEALKNLKLSSQELANLPLDQRIAKINQAISENIPVTERAAVAAELFGAKNQAAMRMLDPETIAEAARQAQIFGTALSDIDAAKVEMAGDSFSTFGVAAEGFAKQLTVQMAPAIDAVGKMFLEAAGEAGGMGNIAKSAFDKIMTASVFVINAIDGIKRVFTIVADSIIVMVSGVVAQVSNDVAWLLSQFSKLPGIDFSATVKSLMEFNATSRSVMGQAAANIHDTLMAPMLGDEFARKVKEAQIASEAAAKDMVASRSKDDGKGTTTREEPEQKALKKKLESESESIAKAEAQKLESLKNSAAARLAEIQKGFMTEQELLAADYELKFAQLGTSLAFEQVTIQEHQALVEQLENDHRQRLGEIRQKADDEAAKKLSEKSALELKYKQQFFSNMIGLTNTNSKKLFDIGKAFAIYDAGVKGVSAAMDAWAFGMKTGGPWLAAAYGGAAALSAANQISNIKSQSFGGGGGGGGGGSAPAALGQGSSGVAAQPQQSANRTITLEGFDPGKAYLGKQLLEFIEDAASDGRTRIMVA